MALGKSRLRLALNEISRRGESRFWDDYVKPFIVLIFFLQLALIGPLDNVLNESLEEDGVTRYLRWFFFDDMGRLPPFRLSLLTLNDDLSLAVTIHDVLKLCHLILFIDLGVGLLAALLDATLIEALLAAQCGHG